MYSLTLDHIWEKEFEKGVEEGIEKGREEGIEKGEKKKAIEIAKELLLNGVDTVFIAKITKLPLKDIETIKESLN